MKEWIVANWHSFSYMTELLLAVFLFMILPAKRRFFPVRVLLGAGVMYVYAYLVNLPGGVPASLGVQFIYWPMFLVVLVPFVYFCLDISLGDAVYCVATASAVQHITFNIWFMISPLNSGVPLRILIYAILYPAAFVLVAKRLVSDGHYKTSRMDILPIVTIMLIVCTIGVWQGYCRVDSIAVIQYRIVDTLCCAYILWGQVRQAMLLKLHQELDGIKHAWEAQKQQYQITAETIETINRSCHDLRYIIRNVGEEQGSSESSIEEAAKAIRIYDTAIKTGNEALDLILMEKSLFCVNHDIQLTCMVDGQKLNRMEDGDIYALFGNALDNAVRAVMPLADSQKKVISIKMLDQGDLLTIQIQNYYDGTLDFQDGLPVTTHASEGELHGYGMKSIRQIAAKYGGTISVKAEDGVFLLNILLAA